MILQEPLVHGRIQLKSRLVIPPMATQSSNDDVPSRETIAHYKKLAGNPLAGLLITEHHYIDQQGKADPYQLSFASDTVIPYQEKLTEAVHAANPDIRFFAQLSHAGVNTSPYITGQELVSASALSGGSGNSRALTIDEILRLERSFAAAARRAKEAGYDGVEIHAAHGYLLNQFYSPLTNYRTDIYGPQSIENRLRFLTETVEAVRHAVGTDFPIAVRLGGCDYIDGGSTVEDAVSAAKLLEYMGIDLLDISGGLHIYTRPGHPEAGWFSDMTTAIKKNVSIPVILTGGVRTPEQAEQLILRGAADLIGVGRAMLRNPAWGADSVKHKFFSFH